MWIENFEIESAKKNLIFEITNVSVFKLYFHLSEPFEYFLMIMGLIGSIATGASNPIMAYLTGSTTSEASTRSKSRPIKFTSSASPHLSGTTWTVPPFAAKTAAFASALNWRFVMMCGRSMTVTLAPRVVAAAIPTRPVLDPSLRILRLRHWSRSVEDKGLLLGSQRW